MEFNVTVDQKAIQKEATETAHRLVDLRVTRLVADYFAASNAQLKHHGGVGYKLVEEQVNAILLSDEMSAYIAKMVQAKLETAVAAAVAVAVEHRARKVVFNTD